MIPRGLYAGVDGGQSSTVAVVADESGRILGRGTAGPADDVGQPPGAVRTAEAIDGAIGAALAAAGLDAGAEFAAVVAGVSGYDAEKEGPAVSLRTHSRAVRLEHDAATAHRGAFGGEAGVLVIAGTGSAGYGVSRPGERVLVGGWGYLFGDAGSAFWLARRAISAAMDAADRDARIPLGEAALRHFGVGSLRAIQHGFADGSIGRPRIAAFAQTICELARSGDAETIWLCGEGALALAELGLLAHRRLGPAAPDLFSYHGGLFRDPVVHERWTLEIVERVAHARVVAPRHDAPVGALLFAYELASPNGPVPEPRETSASGPEPHETPAPVPEPNETPPP